MKLLALLCVAQLLAFVPTQAAAASAIAPAQVVAEDFQAALNRRVAEQPGVGIIVGVIDHGAVTIYKSGSSGTSRPLDEHTLFEIGSVTKTFTATILASMVEDGSVALDDPVSRYLPQNVTVPSRDGKQITLLELATQHSGLPRLPANLNPPTETDPYAGYTVEDMYAFLDTYRLPRDPGQSFEYSNLGVSLLGEALANRAGVPYATLLHDRVLAPLGMDETAVVTTPELQPFLATGHDADGRPVAPWTFQAIAPAGAIRSTLSDMLKYLRCNMGEGPLAKTCAFAQQPRDSFEGHHIGLIWWTDDKTQIVHHGGDTGGYHAEIAVSHERTRGVVVLTNGGTPVEDVALHALDPSLPMSEPQMAIHLDPSALNEYVGYYTAMQDANLSFAIRRVNDGLQARVTGQTFADVYPSAKDHFFYRVVDAQMDFTRDAKGRINGLVLRQNGNTIVAARAGATPPPLAQPSFPPAVTLDAQTLAGYVGTYTAGQGLEFTVTLAGSQLMVQLTGQPSAPVFASAKDHFYYKIVDAQIDFERDASGAVQDLILHQNGQNIKATKATTPS